MNYLRGLVNLPNETESKVDLQQDGKSTRHKQAAQIRRAVKRHKEMQGKEPRARATTARRKADLLHPQFRHRQQVKPPPRAARPGHATSPNPKVRAFCFCSCRAP